MTNRRSYIINLLLPVAAAAAIAGGIISSDTKDCDICGLGAITQTLDYADAPSAPKVDLPEDCTTTPTLTEDVLVVPNDYYSPNLIHMDFDSAFHAAESSKVWIVGYCK